MCENFAQIKVSRPCEPSYVSLSRHLCKELFIPIVITSKILNILDLWYNNCYNWPYTGFCLLLHTPHLFIHTLFMLTFINNREGLFNCFFIEGQYRKKYSLVNYHKKTCHATTNPGQGVDIPASGSLVHAPVPTLLSHFSLFLFLFFVVVVV